MLGLLDLFGGLLAAVEPAMSVLSMGASAESMIGYGDKVMAEYMPEMYDEAEYYPQHFVFSPQDAHALGLSKREWSVCWSAEELGLYALCEGWILSGTSNTPEHRQQLRDLLTNGNHRFHQMTQQPR